MFIGQFYCLDSDGRVILVDAYELDSAALLSMDPVLPDRQNLL